MNRIKVLFFATLRDKAGTRSADMEIEPGLTVGQLKIQLVERFPKIESALLGRCLASINYDYRQDEDVIPADAEVAFFPPVSGG